MSLSNIPSGDEEFGELLDPVDDRPFIFNIEDPEPDDNQKIKDRLAAMEAENAALKAAQAIRPPSYEETYRPPVQQQQQASVAPPQYNPEVDKQIEAELFTPGGAANLLRKFSAAAAELGKQQAMEQIVPLKASIVKQQVAMFTQQNPMDPDVKKEFDKLIKGVPDAQLAQMDPLQIPEQLANLKRLALGSALENGYVPQSYRQAPPNYSGSSGGGSGAGVLQRGQKMLKMTDEQKRTAQIARSEWGWGDKEIYDAIRNGEI